MRLNRSASCSILVLLLEISLTEATIEAISSVVESAYATIPQEMRVVLPSEYFSSLIPYVMVVL
jgi:hypothetical protein